MRRPPEWFVKAIGLLDSLLRIRWSEISAIWVLDRKAVITPEEIGGLKRREAGMLRAINNVPVDAPPNRLHELRIKWMDVKDELDSALDQRRVIFKTRVLTQETYYMLCQSDIRGYGGYARFADALEAEESRREAERQRVWDNKCDARDREVDGMLDFVLRKRQAQLHENNRDLRYLLHGKHTKPEDEPLIRVAQF